MLTEWWNTTAWLANCGSNSSFDEAIATFALGYAEQNERDYDALRKAVGDGRVAASEEPV